MHHHDHTDEPAMLDSCSNCGHVFRAGRSHDCSEGDVQAP